MQYFIKNLSKYRFILTFIAVNVLTLLSFSILASAATDTAANYTPLVGVIPGITSPNGTVNPVTFVESLFKFCIAAATILAVIMITYGGFQYMTTDSISKKGEGRTTINQALIGLVLALTSWLILNTINPNLVRLPQTLGELKCKDANGNQVPCTRLARLKGGYTDEWSSINNEEIGRLAREARTKIENLKDEVATLNAQLKTIVDTCNNTEDWGSADCMNADALQKQIDSKETEITTTYIKAVVGEIDLPRALIAVKTADRAAYTDWNNRIVTHYNEAIQKMHDLGNTEAEQRLVAEKSYQVSSLNTTLRVAEISKEYNSTDKISEAARLQYLQDLKKPSSSQLVPYPDLLTQDQAIKADLIKKLEALPGQTTVK